MQERKNYKQINWRDGMKINKDHFIGLENHLTSCDAEIRSLILDRNSYGLMPLTSDRESNLEYEASIDEQNRLVIRLTTCHALTISGYRIEVTDNPVEFSFNLSDIQEKDLYVGISANPFNRVPIGKADASESPLRQPFVRPEYQLHIIPASIDLPSGLDAEIMPFGRLRIGVEKPEIDNTYIPPCTSIKSHAELNRVFHSVHQQMIALERNIVELIGEIKLKATTNALINIISRVSESVMYYLNSNMSDFKWFMDSRPPLVLIAHIVSLVRSVKNAVETGTPEEREKFLNYLSEHFDINPAKFKQLLDGTLDIDYQHTQIIQSLEKVQDFLDVFSQLINELKKMEFIVGEKRKRKIDIIIR